MSISVVGALIAFVLSVIGIVDHGEIDAADPFLAIAIFTGCYLVDAFRDR